MYRKAIAKNQWARHCYTAVTPLQYRDAVFLYRSGVAKQIAPVFKMCFDGALTNRYTSYTNKLRHFAFLGLMLKLSRVSFSPLTN